MPLNKQQESFALMYFSLPDKPGRGARAAVGVGYSEKTAGPAASRLLAHKGVKARLAELALQAAGGAPSLPGTTPPLAPHPSATGNWPFSPPGTDHSAPPDDPNGTMDPFGGEKFDDPMAFLTHTMNNAKMDPKLRVDAAKKLMDFKYAKIGEGGKKEAKDAAAKEAAQPTGANPFAPGAPPRLKVA